MTRLDLMYDLPLAAATSTDGRIADDLRGIVIPSEVLGVPALPTRCDNQLMLGGNDVAEIPSHRRSLGATEEVP